MPEIDNVPLREQAQRQAALVQGLQAAVYAQPDPSADQGLLDRLLQEQVKLRDLQQQVAAAPTAPVPPQTPPPPAQRPRLLGPETTDLRVETRLHMQPLPTGIYHLLDPEADPLFTVTVQNLATQPRR